MDITEITDQLQFPEGPIAMPDGSVILVEIMRGTLSRVMPDGEIQVVAEPGGGPNGAAMGPCLLYTSPSPRDATLSRMPSSA